MLVVCLGCCCRVWMLVLLSKVFNSSRRNAATVRLTRLITSNTHVQFAATLNSRLLHLTRPLSDSSSPSLFPTSSSTRSVIVRLLQNIGSRREVEQYLKFYSSLGTPKFAVIKVGGGILQDEMDTLADSLSFLSEVGLLPVVLHGAGPQLNDRLKSEGIVSDYINGLRVTTPAILRIATQVFRQANLQLTKALEDRGTRARPIQCGVFEAEFLNAHTHGYVGQVTRVDCSAVYAALSANQIPILTCMGESSSGQTLNINADVAAQELAKQMKPVKIVYLSSNGGINDQYDKLIPTIDLELDYERLMNAPWFRHGNKLKLKEIKTLLDEMPASSSVAITSAANLPKELFTHKGSGTLVRRSEPIHIHTSTSEIHKHKLRLLIEESFNGRLVPDDFFEKLQGKLHRIYLSDSYRATAIVTNDGPFNIPYLDKFAVARLSQSEGTGNALWQILKKDCPRLFWRSRNDNPINGWYFERSDGAITRGLWTVFWYGLEDKTDMSVIGQLVESALSKPGTIDRSQPPINVQTQISSAGSTSQTLGNKRSFSTSTRTSRSLLNSKSISSFSQRRCFSLSTRSASTVKRVGLIGARGHTGVELLKLIAQHPHLTVTVVSSRQLVGRTIAQVVQDLPADCSFRQVQFTELKTQQLLEHDVDVWILALPNGLASPYVSALREAKSAARIVDLSADYRFDSEWTYGLPERHDQRRKIRSSQYISNPGCYATGAQLTLFPLLQLLDLDKYTPTVFGVSGYSGAGTTPSRKNDTTLLPDNLMPYTLINHVHEKEVSHQFMSMNFTGGVRLMPHVASWFRGIQLTTAVQLAQTGLKRDDLIKIFSDYYANEPLVKITDEIPEVRQSASTHHCTIGGFVLDSVKNRLVMSTTLDNLLKGAATQCLQNINLALGFDEFQGIHYQKGIQRPVTAQH